jgi:hypothetical protein
MWNVLVININKRKKESCIFGATITFKYKKIANRRVPMKGQEAETDNQSSQLKLFITPIKQFRNI